MCETGFSSGRERIPQFSISEREDYSILYLPPSLPPSLSTFPPPPLLVSCSLFLINLHSLYSIPASCHKVLLQRLSATVDGGAVQ